jgi:hypothetical protein
MQRHCLTEFEVDSPFKDFINITNVLFAAKFMDGTGAVLFIIIIIIGGAVLSP